MRLKSVGTWFDSKNNHQNLISFQARLTAAHCKLGRAFYRRLLGKELVWRGKECIYHTWDDGDKHCPRYNLIRIKNDNSTGKRKFKMPS